MHSVLSNIDIHNLSISIASTNIGQDALFYFSSSDTTNISMIDILYSYDTTTSCTYIGSISNSVLNASSSWMRCRNPVTAIYNNGQVQIDSLSVGVDISAVQDASTLNKLSNHVFVRFEYEQPEHDDDAAFIVNQATMDITNMVIQQSICYDLLKNNDGSLSLLNLVFVESQNNNYDPNALRSNRIIVQSGIAPSVNVQHSIFIGSGFQIVLTSGTGEIFDCVFKDTSVSIQAQYMDAFKMTNSEIKKSGLYNGPFRADSYGATSATTSMQIYDSNEIFIANNTFSSFDPEGLLLIYDSINVSLLDNIFNIDTTDLFYDLSIKDISFNGPYSPLSIWYNENTMIIMNVFDENNVDVDTSWIDYFRNDGLNCLAANTFNNYAFYTFDTNITSCFRPELIECVNAACELMYGYVDASLFNQVGHFIIDSNADIPQLFASYDNHIALDNINITVINTNNNNMNPIKVSTNKGYLLLVDSYISHDISYYGDLCKILYNDRLSSDTGHIAKLLIHCLEYSDHLLHRNKTMDSSMTTTVSHLSATTMTLMTTTTSYFPGQSLTFKYAITDILGHHIINFTSSHKLIISVEGNRFSTELDIEDNQCPICETGILLNAISLKQNIGDQYPLHLSVENDVLVPEFSEISLHVTGCPVGYGPESNNFSCIVCNTDFYNLSPNNVEECVSCDSEINNGIKCIDGTIYVAENHWIGFDGDTIISSPCPSKYCCKNTNGCDYIDDDKDVLCAPNRDYNSVLCGQCKSGYSESMNSTQCVQCRENHLEYLLLPMLLSLLIACFLMASNTDKLKKEKAKKEVPSKFQQFLKSEYFKIMVKIMIFKNILYYEQSISQIISNSSVQILFKVIASIFNLSIINVANYEENEYNLWCFIDGLNAKQKILVDLFVPIMIVLLLSLFFLISRYGIKKAIIIKDKKVNFAKTAIAAYLMIIGKILDVLFKLLNCEKVGNNSVHYAFGYEQCYGATWILSFVMLLLVVITFSLLFMKIKKMTISERQNPDHVLNKITSRYKPQHYYWEFVIFIRRILVALLAVSVNGITFKFLFVIILFIFAWLQFSYNPFIVHEANNLESILLGSLVIVAVTQISSSIDSVVINVVISLLIILPIPLFCYYANRLFKSMFAENKTEDGAANGKTFQTMEKMLSNTITFSNKNKSDGIDINNRSGGELTKQNKDSVEIEMK